jgi:hypothetical protein
MPREPHTQVVVVELDSKDMSFHTETRLSFPPARSQRDMAALSEAVVSSSLSLSSSCSIFSSAPPPRSSLVGLSCANARA